jgi:hypothetical protein
MSQYGKFPVCIHRMEVSPDTMTIRVQTHSKARYKEYTYTLEADMWRDLYLLSQRWAEALSFDDQRATTVRW